MKRTCRSFFALLIGWLLCSTVPGAEPIISPEPQTETMTPAQEETPNEMQVFIPAGTARSAVNDPLRWGPVVFRPHADYNILYATGLQTAPGQQVNSIVQTISPGLTVDLGRHWVFDYTPSLIFYSNDKLQDSINHNATFTGATLFGDWGLSASQNFNYSSLPDTQTASQARQEDFGTVLNVSYFINSKLSANFGVGQNLQFVDQLQDSQNSYTWSANAGLNYEFWPRLNVGISAGAGYVKVDSGSFASPDQVYESLQLQANWRATDKISFQVQGGMEEREYLGVNGQTLYLLTVMNGTNFVITTNQISPASNLLTPIFSAAIQYQPFRYTQISLSAGRTVSPSLFLNEVTEDTTLGVSLNQRLFQKYHLSVSANYNLTKYTSSIDETQAALFGNGNRRDNTYTATVRLSRNFIKRGTWSIFYEYNDNSSSVGGYSYASNQFGLEVGYRY